MGVRTREKPKDSGVWWVFVSFQGKRTSGKVGNREAAQEVAKQIEARLTLGKDASLESGSLQEALPVVSVRDSYRDAIRRAGRSTVGRH